MAVWWQVVEEGQVCGEVRAGLWRGKGRSVER